MKITEITAELEAGQSEADQFRDIDVGSAVAAPQAATNGGDGDMAGETCWKEMSRRQRKDWKRRGGREGLRPAPSGVDAPF